MSSDCKFIAGRRGLDLFVWYVYDITDTKIRNRIIAIIQKYGFVRVQKSLFAANVSKNTMMMEYIYCPRRIYFSKTLKIPDNDSKNFKMMEGKRLHADKVVNESEYLRKRIKVISKKVINSHEVARFDDKARKIIAELFKAYYCNPKILPDGTLMRVYRDIKKISNNVIDFRNGDPKLIANELKSICFNELFDEHGNINQNSELLIKRKIIVRNITDYLAGMTDNFAINEYNLIFESK